MDDSDQAHGNDTEHVRALAEASQPQPEPDRAARAKYAALLYDVGGWEAFSSDGERAYVSRLWAEDWESAENAAYDDL